ncbi:MAG: hypothetical protein CL869_03405 [Cytophagia bacterium]|nr:hypothetical protein [Cytophagia bacterium]
MLINFYLIFLMLVNLDYLENRAIKKYKKGKYKEAIKIFSNQSSNKKNDEYYFYIGHSYSLTGNNSLAITFYDSAIAINKKYDLAYSERGFSNFIMGNSKKALNDLDAAININANNANYFVNRGSIKYDLGLELSACEDWKTAISLDKKVIDARILNANCY